MNEGTIGHLDDGTPFEFGGGEPRKLNLVSPVGHAHQLLMALPTAEDVIQILPQSEWPSVYGISLEDYTDTWTLDQDGAGSCAWEATANCLMVTRWQQTGEFTLLNPWTGYSRTNRSDTGSDPAENFDVCKQFGLIPDAAWPRASHAWRSLPPDADALAAPYRIDEVFRITNRAELISCVGRRIPVNIGVNWQGGGHAILGCCCLPSGLRIKNSWGSTWNGGDVKPSYKVLSWKQVDQGLATFSCVACRSAIISGPAAGGMGQ